MAHKVSPLAPERFPDLPPVAGVRVATANCGIRYKGRDDLMLAVLDPGTTIAGVTTRSKTCSAPVLWCREHLPKGKARALVVNSGNSNAFTGKAGRAFLDATVAGAAAAVGCRPEEVFAASTGVIGQPMTPDQIARHLPAVVPTAAPGRFDAAAKAIMTTDTYPKGAVATATVGGKTVTIVGIAKGSGMIAPDMATMLAFVFTDAAVAAPHLQDLVSKGTRRSFNAVTVDGDTSTSDTLLVCATGKAGNPTIAKTSDPGARAFAKALDAVLLDLALQIVKDGEGGAEAGDDRRDGRRLRPLGPPHRHGDRQLAPGEDGDRRRGRQLGPHRHGGRQVGRAGGARPPQGGGRRRDDRGRRAAPSRATTRRPSPPT